MLGLKLDHVSKSGPSCQWVNLKDIIKEAQQHKTTQLKNSSGNVNVPGDLPISNIAVTSVIDKEMLRKFCLDALVNLRLDFLDHPEKRQQIFIDNEIIIS